MDTYACARLASQVKTRIYIKVIMASRRAQKHVSTRTSAQIKSCLFLCDCIYAYAAMIRSENQIRRMIGSVPLIYVHSYACDSVVFIRMHGPY